MFYSIPYCADSEYLDIADEVRILTDFKKLDNLKDFLELRKKKASHQAVYVKWFPLEEEAEDSDYALYLQRILEHAGDYIDYNVIFEVSDENYVSKFRSEGLSTCYTSIIKDWDTLHAVLNRCQPDQLYIGGSLGFDIIRVSRMCKRYNISVRAEGDIATFSKNLGKDDEWYWKFFIRPEDTAFYEGHIDILSLCASYNKQEKAKIDTTYRLYAIDKKWDGAIDDLISCLQSKLHGNVLMATEWAKYRIDCDRACMKGSTCRICPSQISIANSLSSVGYCFVNK